MDKRVYQALKASVDSFAKVENVNGEGIKVMLEKAFDTDKPFMEKVGGLDAAFDDNPHFEPLREVFFDLLMINFFTEDVRKLEEDYLESKEWEDIEEETLDRGTELLNVLLYLRECEDEDIDPSLDDFLKEFLLVEEDEFQDEHHIYEDVIANQILVETSYEEISKVAAKLPQSSELKDLFYPLMSFFYEQKPSESDLAMFAGKAHEKAFESAAYALLINFNK
ncbi:MAG TPA: hypothetical protein VGE26_03125 [Sphingobacteriaceae bacterium]